MGVETNESTPITLAAQEGIVPPGKLAMITASLAGTKEYLMEVFKNVSKGIASNSPHLACSHSEGVYSWKIRMAGFLDCTGFFAGLKNLLVEYFSSPNLLWCLCNSVRVAFLCRCQSLGFGAGMD